MATSAAVLVLAACGPDATAGDSDRPTPPLSSAPGDPVTGSPSGGEQSSRPSSQHLPATEEHAMRIHITIGDQHFRPRSTTTPPLATWPPNFRSLSTSATTAVWKRLARFPLRYPWRASRPGADPDVGDVGYYARQRSRALLRRRSYLNASSSSAVCTMAPPTHRDHGRHHQSPAPPLNTTQLLKKV